MTDAAPKRGLLLGYAAASFLAFPHPLAERVVDLGLVFAYLAPACLIFALHGLAPKRAARWGFAAGVLAHSAILHWIYVVTVRYGGAPVIFGAVAPILLASYIAAFSAAFAAAAAWLAARGPASPFALAACWTAVDWLRSFVLTGFPWATLGYAQHANRPLLGLAAWTGVYGLSFASALGGAALAGAAAAPRGARLRAFAPAALGVLALHGLGLVAAPAQLAGGATLRIALLQGNIDQGVKWSDDWAQRTLRIYAALTREAAAEGARVIVWPETAVPGSLDQAELAASLAALAREAQATLVVGAIGLDWRAGADSPLIYDSAFVVEPDGEFTARYDKTHLVPFGEYVPLRAWIGQLVKGVATGSIGSDATPGAAVRALSLGGAEPGVRVGVPICYELLFPNLVRRFTLDGGQVLLAITNDAWYGRTGAPYQFLAMTALRSAELGVWTARAANTGVSAFIDSRGSVRQATPIFERGKLVADVPLRAADATPTFYARTGDWLGWLSALGCVGYGLRGRRAGAGAIA